ncbi:MAG: ATP-binding cassette domain-containing protein [Sphingobacteriaceae bacterium]|nr:MAG: ATP-binding cassette domain-containing protein [Sphingobacteriaceae bacterium]
MEQHEIDTIRKQFLAGSWAQFLETVEIHGLRGWTGQAVNFQFPVVAIVGENGTGKSTLLKSAASAYQNKEIKNTYYPSTFFAETHWDKIQNVILNYRIRRGNESLSFKISKPSKRWGFPDKRIVRNVFLFDISRTLPLDASAGYAKIAKLAASEIKTTQIDEQYRKRLSHVLGREYKNARFAFSNVDQKRDVGVLEREFGEISQFHQGAGEDATLDLFRALQEIPEHSLLIIDEVEASLHPRAQRRLIRFLLWLSRQKRIQVILSTHSPYILEELPQEARVLLLPGPSGLNIIYGVTPEFAMSRMDEGKHPELILFVEDKESAVLLREVLATQPNSSELLSKLDLRPVGASNVVQMMGKLSNDNKLPFPALGVLDGDSDKTKGTILIPGTLAPERQIFQDLKAKNWINLVERFGIGAGTLYTVLDDAMLEPDHHKWTTLVGDKILKSSAIVWEILANEWAKSCLSSVDANRITMEINDTLSATAK